MKEDAQKFAEGDADGGDGSGLYHEKQRPAVEKSPERPERLTQVNVLAAGVRHHGSELAIGQRTGDGQKSGEQPGADEQRRRIDQAGNVGRDDKNARADHRAHDDRRRADRAEAFYEPRVGGRGRNGFYISGQGTSKGLARVQMHLQSDVGSFDLRVVRRFSAAFTRYLHFREPAQPAALCIHAKAGLKPLTQIAAERGPKGPHYPCGGAPQFRRDRLNPTRKKFTPTAAGIPR